MGSRSHDFRVANVNKEIIREPRKHENTVFSPRKDIPFGVFLYVMLCNRLRQKHDLYRPYFLVEQHEQRCEGKAYCAGEKKHGASKVLEDDACESRRYGNKAL